MDFYILLDAIKAQKNVRFVTFQFHQNKFGYIYSSSKEVYYYGEKSSVLAGIYIYIKKKNYSKFAYVSGKSKY